MEIVLHGSMLCQGRIARFVESPEKKFPFLIITVLLNPVRVSGIVFRDHGKHSELKKDVRFDQGRTPGTFYLPAIRRLKPKELKSISPGVSVRVPPQMVK